MAESTSENGAKVIHIDDFGGRPDTGKETGAAVRAALAAALTVQAPVVLEFKKGRYDFYSENSIKVPYFISNTTSEEENPDITKNIGIHIKGIKDLTIEGNGSLLLFHGKMTTMVIDQSDAVEVRNISIDFARPTMSEMTVEAIGSDSIDFKVHRDSWYEINEERLAWVGEGFRYTSGPAQEYDPTANTTWRTWNPACEAERVTELEPFYLRFTYKAAHPTKIGNVFQMRDGIRDQVGAFINRSSNISFTNVNFHYMHGLGIVGQYCENLYFSGLQCAPRVDSGRTTAGFADFLHLSGCKGKITVLDSRFIGAHDDPINVHGTHLMIAEKRTGNALVVRFMHPQTYGFEAFSPDDTVDFVDSAALTVLGSACVKSAERLTDREIMLVFDRPVPERVCIGDVVENASWTPNVEIRRNYFARVPTRGILVTTRKRVVISDNVFERMGMEGILIADDAKSWYESGMVSDVTICNNEFIGCADPVININPENSDIRMENPIHRNICIESNEFLLNTIRTLYAKSTQGLRFVGNELRYLEPEASQSGSPMIELLACNDVEIANNTVEGEQQLTILKQNS